MFSLPPRRLTRVATTTRPREALRDSRRRRPEGATRHRRDTNTMKRMMGTVLIAGFLVVTADLEAAQKRFDRVKSMDGPKPEVALANGLQLAAASDFGSPPPAPAENPVFQAPANDTVTQAPANDTVLGAPANGPVLQAPPNAPVLLPSPGDAVSVPPAPLPPVGLPGPPSALPPPEAAPGFAAAGSPPMQLAPRPPCLGK